MHFSSFRSLLMMTVPAALSLAGCGGDPGAVSTASEALGEDAGEDRVQIMRPVGWREAAGIAAASTANDLNYHGGTGGIGVETAPRVYLVLWGSQWSSDPSGEAALLT